MLANSLTKGHEKWQLELYFRNGCRWRVVYDEKFESAKRRKKKGLAALEQSVDYAVEEWCPLSDDDDDDQPAS